MNEFKEAVELLEACRGTISCGCQMTVDEEIFAHALKRICKEYIASYDARIKNQ